MRNFPARLLLSNRAWVANRLELKTNYFELLASGQAPEALWVGCCDSRAPAEEITGARPGELFVHRNIANLVKPDDASIQSVLYYSLVVLKVKHVIVCGHTGCGGVLAAIQGVRQEPLKTWLAPVCSLVDRNGLSYKSPSEIPPELSYRIVKSNVTVGVETLRRHPLVREAFEAGTLKTIHGWVYALESGLIEPICECSGHAASVAKVEYTEAVRMLWR